MTGLWKFKILHMSHLTSLFLCHKLRYSYWRNLSLWLHCSLSFSHRGLLAICLTLTLKCSSWHQRHRKVILSITNRSLARTTLLITFQDLNRNWSDVKCSEKTKAGIKKLHKTNLWHYSFVFRNILLTMCKLLATLPTVL